MALREIVQAGTPVLRRRARPLDPAELATDRIRTLLDDMRDTMRAAPGVGLAAPQIGEGLALVVIEDDADRQASLSAEQLVARERAVVPFHVLVNPRLTVVGEGVVDAFEGCLSVAGFVMGVARAHRVHVEALDELGRPIAIDAHGWYARILQHEVDHLHGVLCCDRMDPRTLATVANQAAHWPGATPAQVRALLAEG
jgi:peptide deformylase